MPYRVAILGAGFPRLGMAARLQDSCENSSVILEKAAGIGGASRDNFDEQPDWSHIFSPRQEILRNRR